MLLGMLCDLSDLGLRRAIFALLVTAGAERWCTKEALGHLDNSDANLRRNAMRVLCASSVDEGFLVAKLRMISKKDPAASVRREAANLLTAVTAKGL
jgi:hypothetical protein